MVPALRNPKWSSALLYFITAAVFLPALWGEFIDFDDRIYIYGNEHVTAGLTLGNLRWAFIAVDPAWHPVTWISHQLDCALFGLDPMGPHLVNVLLHGLNAVLLFRFFLILGGRYWPSFFITLLFSIHPMRVESVAWACERKDCLSFMFSLLTLISYVRYLAGQTRRQFIMVVGYFALGLLAKPSIVTLPLILLLLDFWPLRRSARISTLLIEKVPLFVLSMTVCAVTIHATHVMRTISELPITIAHRFDNAAVSYCRYILHTILPTDLCALYPYPAAWRGSIVLVACVALSAICASGWLLRKHYPHFLTGWLWYLVLFAPTIGIVQFGPQSMADRYALIPTIGLMIALIWSLPRRYSQIQVGVGISFVLLLSVSTVLQFKYWRNELRLWSHAVDVTNDNFSAENKLARAYFARYQYPEAIQHFKEAVRIRPQFWESQYSLIQSLKESGQKDEIIPALEGAVQAIPESESFRMELAGLLVMADRSDEAIEQLRECVKLQPEAETYYRLGIVLLKSGKMAEGRAQLEHAAQLAPDREDIKQRLATIL